MNLLNTMKKLVGAAAALLLATSMSFGQSESSIEFTIPYANAAQQADVEAMGGSAVANLAEGSYTLISSKSSASKSKKNTSKAENDGLPLEVNCSLIVDAPVECRSDLPPVDFNLPIILHSQGDVILSALTIIPGNSGCPGNAVIIPRTYFIQDDMGMAQCMQTFTIESTMPPVITCPADVTVNCNEDTSPANTGTATVSASCSNFSLAITFADVSTQQPSGCGQYTYTISRTWTATDGCGRTAVCIQIISVEDITPPALIGACPTATDLGLPASVLCSADLPTGTDAELAFAPNGSSFYSDCALAEVNIEDPVITGSPCSGIATYTVTVADACGNANSDCTFTIAYESVNDLVINCPAPVTLDCFDQDTSPANTGEATATSDCGPLTTSFTDVSTQVMDGSLLQYNYTITRTWTSSVDNCGRTATCDQIITVASTDACLRMNGIPTMGQWALLILALLMSSLAVVFIKRKSMATA